MDLISLIVAVVVIGVVFWALKELAGVFAIPAPIVVVIKVVLVLVVVFWLLRGFGFAPNLTIGR